MNARATCQAHRDLTSASQLMHRQGKPGLPQEMGHSWGAATSVVGRLTVMLPGRAGSRSEQEGRAKGVRTGHP